MPVDQWLKVCLTRSNDVDVYMLKRLGTLVERLSLSAAIALTLFRNVGGTYY